MAVEKEKTNAGRVTERFSSQMKRVSAGDGRDYCREEAA